MSIIGRNRDLLIANQHQYQPPAVLRSDETGAPEARTSGSMLPSMISTLAHTRLINNIVPQSTIKGSYDKLRFLLVITGFPGIMCFVTLMPP
jgi:hypothetical protein